MLLLLASSALATNYSVKFCAEYSTDYVDADAAVGDDYFVSNADRVVRGAALKVTRNSDLYDVFFYYTDDSGTNAGCTSTLTLDSGQSYKVSVQSLAYINGNTIEVWDDHGSPSIHASVYDSNFIPSSSTTITWSTIVAPHWNVAAAMGYGM